METGYRELEKNHIIICSVLTYCIKGALALVVLVSFSGYVC